jgi:hypothetical protein
MDATFKSQRVLNSSEARVFEALTQAVLRYHPSWHALAQVSLGEVFSSEDPSAYSCINAKRVDLLIVDQNCMPKHAIEFQGAGHFKGTAAARDAVKKEALRRSGIGYHEVMAGHTTPSDLRQLIERLVEKSPAGSNTTSMPAQRSIASEIVGGDQHKCCVCGRLELEFLP